MAFKHSDVTIKLPKVEPVLTRFEHVRIGDFFIHEDRLRVKTNPNQAIAMGDMVIMTYAPFADCLVVDVDITVRYKEAND